MRTQHNTNTVSWLSLLHPSGMRSSFSCHFQLRGSGTPRATPSEIGTQSFVNQIQIVSKGFSGKFWLACLVAYLCVSGINNNKNISELYYTFMSILLVLSSEVFFGYIRGERVKAPMPLKAIIGSGFRKNNACQEWHLCDYLFLRVFFF